MARSPCVPPRSRRARYDGAPVESRVERARGMTAGMPTPSFRFDPAGLEIMSPADRFDAFIASLDTLTLANLMDRLAATYGARTAFILEQPLALPGGDGTTLSFSELGRLVVRATAAFHRLGLRRGERVALCTRNRMELAVAEWAVVRAGGVAVPVGSRIAPEEIIRMIEDAGARLLVADRQVLGGPLKGHRVPVEARVVVDGDDADGALGLARL